MAGFLCALQRICRERYVARRIGEPVTFSTLSLSLSLSLSEAPASALCQYLHWYHLLYKSTSKEKNGFFSRRSMP